MLKTTTWKPDTCDCVLEYEWDDQQDENTRTHAIKRVIKACPDHAGNVKNEHFNKVVDENTRKNKVHQFILDNMPELIEEVTDQEGKKVKQLKPGIEYKFSFDKQRVLHAEIVGGNLGHKNLLRSFANTKFGNGKVDVK